MTTLNFPPVPLAPVQVQRSNATVSDALFAHLGVKSEAQRAVYRAIKAQTLRHESSVARAAALDDVSAARALRDLEHAGLVRRSSSLLGGLVGAFEIINRK